MKAENISSKLPNSLHNPREENDFSEKNYFFNLISSRNYSDIMRSLAAKYNNNKNELILPHEKLFYESGCRTSNLSVRRAFPSNDPPTDVCVLLSKKDKPSRPCLPFGDSELRHHHSNKIATGHCNVSFFISSLLSSLHSTIPQMIDMSSTQTLITLARLSKEIELQSILNHTQDVQLSSSITQSGLHRNLTCSLKKRTDFFAPHVSLSPHHLSEEKKPQESSLLKHTVFMSKQKTQSEKTVALSLIGTPLDLSSHAITRKRKKSESGEHFLDGKHLHKTYPAEEIEASILSGVEMNQDENTESALKVSKQTTLTTFKCRAQRSSISAWSVEEVCSFIESIDICAEYAQNFREQCIDGFGLPLLTEDHLLNSLRMKLGPALKLRSIISKKLEGSCPCVFCDAETQIFTPHSMHALEIPSTALSSSKTHTSLLTKSTDIKMKEANPSSKEVKNEIKKQPSKSNNSTDFIE